MPKQLLSFSETLNMYAFLTNFENFILYGKMINIFHKLRVVWKIDTEWDWDNI